MKKKQILVVEDERNIAELIRDYLVAADFSVIVKERGDEALEAVRRNELDLILLDIMLPGKDGLEVCRDIRRFSQIPIIMVTARVEEIDRIIGLEYGADDYICKPFSPRELVARVKTVLRRIVRTEKPGKMELGDIIIDNEKHEVTAGGAVLVLTPTEFNLLRIMASCPNKVFSRQELLEKAMGYDYDGYDRVVDSHIKNLRKKIAAALPESDVINSVYGIGYRLTSPAQ